MKLYILRHGHAPSIIDAGVRSDADRPLSKQGRDQIRRSVKHLVDQGGRPALILHSPLKRAVETAQEAETLIQPRPRRDVFLPLSNSMASEPLYAEISRRAEGLGEVLIVGHQPQLGELAAYLTDLSIPFSTGGLLAVETSKSTAARRLWDFAPGGAS